MDRHTYCSRISLISLLPLKLLLHPKYLKFDISSELGIREKSAAWSENEPRTFFSVGNMFKMIKVAYVIRVHEGYLYVCIIL